MVQYLWFGVFQVTFCRSRRRQVLEIQCFRLGCCPHNPKVGGSNPPPQPKDSRGYEQLPRTTGEQQGTLRGHGRAALSFPVLLAALTPSARPCCLPFFCSPTLQIRTPSWWSECLHAASTPAALSWVPQFSSRRVRNAKCFGCGQCIERELVRVAALSHALRLLWRSIGWLSATAPPITRLPEKSDEPLGPTSTATQPRQQEGCLTCLTPRGKWSR
jgi:hypothetical protein